MAQTGFLISNISSFLTVLEAEGPSSGGQHGRVSVRTRFRVADLNLLLVSSPGGEKTAASAPSTLTGALIPPVMQGPRLMLITPQRPRLLIPSHSGVEFQHMNVGGTQTCSPQSRLQKSACTGQLMNFRSAHIM